MKYFSLSFKNQKADYAAYYKDFRKAQVANMLKRALPMAIFTICVILFFSTQETLTLIVPLVFVLIVSIIMPFVYSRKISDSLYESKQSKKEARYDFYADHIEIHVPADEEHGGTTEKHLKMSGFTSVTESKSNFYFSYMNEKMLIIPKRVLDEEKYQMIKNLIENYFSDVYMTI